MSEITSFQNPLVKRIKRLRIRKYRQREGAYFVEGLRVVIAAVEAGAPVETIVYCPELLTSEIARRMVEEQSAAGLPCVALSRPVFESVSERDNPVGLGAIVKATVSGLAGLAVGPDDLFVGLVELSDPGNLGTIVRTADGAGVAGVILVGQTVDPYHPAAVKASMGALYSVPVYHAAGIEALINWAVKHHVHTVATSARARRSFWEVSYHFPALLLLGSEGEGLPAELLEASELAVSIPMRGTASSLNLAVAAGLLIYEIRRAALLGM